MKKMLLLAFFGLVVRMAVVAQVWSINSPTTDNLNCLVMDSVSTESNFPNLFVFGDNGLGYVTKDKCKTWTTLNIDPIQKRDINLATRVNDSIIFLSGGLENNLLKYSTDNGLTFKDFTLLDPTEAPMRNLIPFNGLGMSIIAFNQVNGMNGWNKEWGMFPIDLFYPEKNITLLEAVVDADYVRMVVTTPVHGTSGFHNSFYSLSFKLNKDWEPVVSRVGGELRWDSITTLASYKGVSLISCHKTYYDSQVKSYNYEGRLDSYETVFYTNWREFPQLGKEMSIKASLVSHANLLFWHVGGDNNGQNGFMIRDGVIIKNVPEAALKAIADCSYDGIDAAIAIGNNGKIYATRSDLTLATANALIWRDEDKLSAYPNPFNSELTIKSSSEAIVTLSDVLGTVIQQIRVEPGDNRISLVGLRTGIYFLNNKKTTLKLIKQ